MQAKSIAKGEGNRSLEILSIFLKYVALPLQAKRPDVRNSIAKFLSSLENSFSQVSGSITIKLPANIEPDDAVALRSKETIEKYEGLLNSWTEDIKLTIDKENMKQSDSSSALAVIEYWRSKAAVFSTLYQELSKTEVNIIKTRVRNFHESTSAKILTTVLEFEEALRDLNKNNSDAKENVKFLSTLEKQFKILQSDDLSAIEQSLPSLLNGLKLVFTISRNYRNSNNISQLLTTIANELCKKVQTMVTIERLFKPPDENKFEEHIESSLSLLNQCQSILELWVTLYNKTRSSLELESSGEQWSFDAKQITNKPQYMVTILKNLITISENLQKFLAFLTSKLKEVTGNSKEIDELVKSVKDVPNIFLDYQIDYFEKSMEGQWKMLYQKFITSSKEIEGRTLKLISSTFKELRSSKSAFKLLQRFKNLKTLGKINEELQKRYLDVLNSYERELDKEKEMFKKYKELNYVTKHMPPVAGSIFWKRAMFLRIKTPIVRFISNEAVWQDQIKNFNKIKDEEYKTFAQTLDLYQKEKYEAWTKQINQNAVNYLNERILERKIENGQVVYRVKFNNEFRVLLAEARYLDRLGEYKLSSTILTIALQEREYFKSVDKLNNMLKEYNTTIGSLKDVEKDLMKKHIDDLNAVLDPGADSYNLSTLGVNEFILDCLQKIRLFHDTKNKVDDKTKNIEDTIRAIEEGRIIKDFDFENKNFDDRSVEDNYMTLQQFYTNFEKYLQDKVSDLAEKYLDIGNHQLTFIESTLFGTVTEEKSRIGKHPAMLHYYQYWERRVYNALIKMILRGLLTLKYLLNKRIPLFKIPTEFQYPEAQTIPDMQQLKNQLQKIFNMVHDAGAKFPRWEHGTCIIKHEEQLTEDDQPKYSFLNDIKSNDKIVAAKVDVNNLNDTAHKRIIRYKSFWDEHKSETVNEANNAHYKRLLSDEKQKYQIERILEKNPQLIKFEYYLKIYKDLLQEFEEYNDEMLAEFIMVDFTPIKKYFIEKAQKQLNIVTKLLIKLAEKEVSEISKEIEEYNLRLQDTPQDTEELKNYLNTIANIRAISLDNEFRIIETKEKCRLLKKYKKYLNKKKPEKFLALEQKTSKLKKQWKCLLLEAKNKDRGLKQKKETFSKTTEGEVQMLKKDIKVLFEKFKKSGPGAPETDLNDGLNMINSYRNQINALNKKKEIHVQEEKLFNLPVSNYNDLNNMEDEMKKLEKLYGFYEGVKTSMNEWSEMYWTKLEYNKIKDGEKSFKISIKKLETEYSSDVTFLKIKAKITEFINSLPVIDKIKLSPHFTHRHWEQLMREIGMNTQEINTKEIRLKQVFAMRLQDYNDKVDAILTQATKEAKNEADVQTIETYWKNANFEIKDYKKRATTINVNEEHKTKINDDLAMLQTIESSKNVGGLVKTIRMWIDSLSKIQETYEIWLQVQRKWMYLEGIFAGNEDIKQQLAKETKNFGIQDKNFKKLNEQCLRNPNIYANCITNDSNQTVLKQLSVSFDKTQKSLNDYLTSKKKMFPRFYFISDEDLLGILGSSDLANIEQYLIKLFDNCKKFIADKNKVKGMKSEEGESYEFKDPVKADGAVETWMTAVDLEMQKTLKVITKEAVYFYSKEERTKWIERFLGMTVFAGTQIWWTWRVEDVFQKVRAGNKHAMKQESAKQTADLLDLIGLVRTNLEEKEDPDKKGLSRLKLNTLIILDVHARDIVDRFVRDSILRAREFEWESQLRFYWLNTKNDIEIQQCTGKFSYGYEYQGLNGRLVITPLTDRCVMTLTTALTFKLGGAPQGPAGTGKTETCKDLAKSLGIRCVVTNCGDTFDAFAMGNNFSGLCQTGFWGCFDEFNRIAPSVLSVVSTQISEIQKSLGSDKNTVQINGQNINLVPTLGIFVTMNPGYEGRSELPDNLKAMFRPVTMVVPDLNIICENMLMSQGFTDARKLAKKMTVLYKLAQEQLSKQYHYDFQLRAIKSVLVMAGSLKRDSPDVDEEKILMRALRDQNMPKFVHEDVHLFLGLVKDLFPEVQISALTHENLRKRTEEIIENMKFKKLEEQISKVIQLFETMGTRHTTMIVGPTGSGKSTVIELLKQAQTIQKVKSVITYTINPKAQPVLSLYGDMDPNTREWTDGIFSKTFRHANERLDVYESGKEKDELRWIIFDGDVDAIWVENMNSVMDDNKLLTLTNGDRIRLEKYCKILFEVFDLQYASPATISRCGMVYVDPRNLGYIPYFEKWKKKFSSDKQKEDVDNMMEESMTELFDKFVPKLVDFIYEGKVSEETLETPLEMVLPRTNLNLVQQLTHLIDTLIPEEPQHFEIQHLEAIFLFSLVWSFGACIKENQRERFQRFIREQANFLMINSSLYDYYFDVEDKQWVAWDKKFDLTYIPPKNSVFSKILVPTIDTARYSHILGEMIKKKFPVLFVGDPGTAKTVIIQNYLNKLSPEEYIILLMNFSSRTSSLEVQKNIEDVTVKRRPGLWGPPGGKNLIAFIDELHMPNVDRYGTQQPIALLKFLLDKEIMYERGGQLELRVFKDVQFVTALLPPGGGYNSVDPRFLSLFNCFNVVFPSEENIKKIYSTILKTHLAPYPDEIRDMVGKITDATYLLYQNIIINLPRSPTKFHYIFNLRDLGRVYEGLSKSSLEFTNKKETFLRLWRHECLRVFTDRLTNDKDRYLVANDKLSAIITDKFGKDLHDPIMANPLIFSDVTLISNIEETEVNIKLKEFTSIEDVTKICENLLEILNENSGKKLDKKDFTAFPSLDLVLFQDAVYHLLRIIRILRFPKGHCLLVGYGGSGKQSLAKLATFITQMSIFQVQLTRSYKETNFRDDLFKLFSTNLWSSQGETVFLLTDSQIVNESFLELINTILTVGVINNIFDDNAKNELRAKVANDAKKEGAGDTNDELWNFIIDRFKKNLHMIMCMSPAGETLRVRCRNFPGLVSSCNIDWYFPWPEDALNSVAQYYLADLSKDNLEEKNNIIKYAVNVHLSVPKISDEFEEATKRKNYSTPKNYLDFLSSFKGLLEKNIDRFQKMIQKYGKGVKKLNKTAILTTKLQESIGGEKEKVLLKKTDVDKLVAQIEKQSIELEKQKSRALEQKKDLDIQEVEIKEKKEKAAALIFEVQPVLDSAREKVKTIKANDIGFIKGMANPPEPIRLVVGCLQAMKINEAAIEDGNWQSAQAMLQDQKLIQKLIDFSDPEKRLINTIKGGQMKKVNELLDDLKKKLGTEKTLKDIHSAADKLGAWVYSMKTYYEINQKILPLENDMQKIEVKATKLRKDKIDTEARLNKLNSDYESCLKTLESSQKEAKELDDNLQSMIRKLNSAQQLINGLKDETVRWGLLEKEYSAKLPLLVGECLMCSTFLSYFGPFDQEFRRKMFTQFLTDLKNKSLKVSDGFKVEDLLTDEVEIAQWNNEGLPRDELSIQNGILTTQVSRYPLCIDPQLQAVSWIKKKIFGLKITNFRNDNFASQIIIAVKTDSQILIENIGEELDPFIDPLLEKNYVYKGSIKVRLGDEEPDIDPSKFKIYLTTKFPKPHYTPEIMGKSSVINFTVTLSGLTEQLLNETVAFERKEMDELRKELIKKMSENKKKLKDLENQLIALLQNTKGSLLDNEDLIHTLDNAREESKSIAEKIADAIETNKGIENAMQGYLDVAKRGAILFFSMRQLAALSQMYEYSLSLYLDVFKISLEQVGGSPDEIVISRVMKIIDKLTHNIYDYTCLGIFERHKLLFSLQMTTMIMEEKGHLNKIELDFFLKGNSSSIDGVTRPKPCKWLSDNGWKDIQQLITLGEDWAQLADHLEANEIEWKKWSDVEKPEETEPPAPFNVLINKRFQMLLLLRVIRPDRVINGIKRFITNYMQNEYYVISPTIQYSKIFKQSSEKSPIIFILSPGADPYTDVCNLAKDEGISAGKFNSIALGQKTEDKAKELIEGSAQRGNWAMLLNCDLLEEWLKDLEKILEGIVKPHKDFRLWLTTKPIETFPLGILQRSLKVVTEPPDGLKANIKKVLSGGKLKDENLNDCNHFAFKPLVYVLVFTHAILLDRRKYGKIGWNVSYDFNEADFQISRDLLQLYLKKSIENKDDNIPWGSLKYLIGEAMYGGRVTDEFDRRVLVTYLDEYMGDFLFDKNNPFFFSHTNEYDYALPKYTNLESLVNYVNSNLPNLETPVVFGLNPNAEITYFSNAANKLYEDMLCMQSASGVSENASKRDEKINQVASGILSKLPKVYEVHKYRNEEGESISPTRIVLFQEMERMNVLINEINSTLINLQRSLRGEIGMNQELDELAVSLYNGFLPSSWRRRAPPTEKKLSSWVEYFLKRDKQYLMWKLKGDPLVLWLSGLHIPGSYLTALVQTVSRNKKWALDRSTLYTVVTKYRSSEEVTARAEHSCYISGLCLEGASWDLKSSSIIKQSPKELITEMPVIQIIPVESNKLKLKDSLQVPVYATQNRKNPAGAGLVFTADLTTYEHPSHWVLQGICLVLNTDQQQVNFEINNQMFSYVV